MAKNGNEIRLSLSLAPWFNKAVEVLKALDRIGFKITDEHVKTLTDEAVIVKPDRDEPKS